MAIKIFIRYYLKVKEYLFDKTLKQDIQMNGHLYQIGAILPSYKRDLAEGFHSLSADSIRNRFHGIKKEFSEQELNYLTHLDGINHYAIGLRNAANQGIAVARMIRNDSMATEAEVAITIIDKYQKRGLGSFLFKCIAFAAYERGVQTLIINLLDHNEGMMKITGVIGRISRRVRYLDNLTLYLELNEMEMKRIESELKEQISFSF